MVRFLQFLEKGLSYKSALMPWKEPEQMSELAGVKLIIDFLQNSHSHYALEHPISHLSVHVTINESIPRLVKFGNKLHFFA